jgi:hypothetical protein
MYHMSAQCCTGKADGSSSLLARYMLHMTNMTACRTVHIVPGKQTHAIPILGWFQVQVVQFKLHM